MNKKSPSLIKRWWSQLFPQMPDFHSLLNQQCQLLAEGTAELAAYMQTGDDTHADRVIAIEHEGDAVKESNMNTLHQAFATPFDREDIYRSIVAIDEILNYAKSTIREMRGLQLSPDEHTRAMAAQLHEGALALQRGYQRLAEQPLKAEADAEAAHKTERAVERIYRQALSELFDASHYMATLTPEQQQAADDMEVLMQDLNTRELSGVGSAMGFVVEILKRREVYRHMSNAADRVAGAGQVLEDIVAKIA